MTLTDITELIKRKNSPLPALQNESAIKAITTIAEALHPPPLEKSSVPTSEGAYNRNINTNHPVPPKLKTKTSTKPKVRAMTDEEFNKIIQELKNSSSIKQKPKSTIKTQHNFQPLAYQCPTPKQQSIESNLNVPVYNKAVGTPRLTRYTHEMPSVQQKLQLMQAQSLAKCLNHIYDTTGSKQSLDDLLKGPMKRIWELSVAREI